MIKQKDHNINAIPWSPPSSSVLAVVVNTNAYLTKCIYQGHSSYHQGLYQSFYNVAMTSTVPMPLYISELYNRLHDCWLQLIDKTTLNRTYALVEKVFNIYIFFENLQLATVFVITG